MPLTCAIHLYLPVRGETLVVKYKQQEAFNDDLDLSAKFGKQLEVGLLCWEHEGISGLRSFLRQCFSFHSLTVFFPSTELLRKILRCGIVD